MSVKTQIKLKKDSVQQLPFDSYEKDFSFVVNGREFQTSRFVADLLSPTICQLHAIDPTIDHFTINTEESGDFSLLLNLINFKVNEIPERELPFIASVIEKLKIQHIEIDNEGEAEGDQELTIDKVIQNIEKHEKNQIFYRKKLEKEIEFLSSHFFDLKEDEVSRLKFLKKSTIEEIIKNDHLRLKEEDQLLRTINDMYAYESENSYFYGFVIFENLSGDGITEFIDQFDKDDMSSEIWNSISNRLKRDIVRENETSKETTNERYCKEAKVTEIQRKGIKISFNNENKLDGIINYMKKQSNGNILNLINITASKEESPSSYPLKNIILYEDDSKYTYTANAPDSWICIDFKEHRIIPTHYTVRTANTDCHLKNWVIEGSSDNSSWEKLDEQSNCSVTNGNKIVHTFPISNQDCKEYRYVRIRTTGPNWGGNNYLDLSAFEFHGTLI